MSSIPKELSCEFDFLCCGMLLWSLKICLSSVGRQENIELNMLTCHCVHFPMMFQLIFFYVILDLVLVSHLLHKNCFSQNNTQFDLPYSNKSLLIKETVSLWSKLISPDSSDQYWEMVPEVIVTEIFISRYLIYFLKKNKYWIPVSLTQWQFQH